ncbi:hypothetical protein SPRG_06625 [Saprolegnia parasitica CBS 223.65]|uniref:Uncharacterized protein n=1 Tax=Saprolegnia parasitica (strain CBS 223.65) TaxID=695850 RepID=A0A067CNJ0_SAPPC|nr:hypothetical protein SPRG_06625 [Saprolegnia parasitica CBS 223.65]KDO28387.1 hypothetical protein SPRG_06625 [Saprolegnia parasitica CBS 223.65]|eukprot:XP_012200829.1 hypothetical protein SPRG_06625 [Saprolegnia parasitica CBS 223.65]
MELVRKSSHGLRYAPSSSKKKATMTVMPYSGLGQLSSSDDEVDEQLRRESQEGSPTYPSRWVPPVSRHNNNQETEVSPRTSSISSLYDPPSDVKASPRPSTTNDPARVLITVRRKVTFEARVRLHVDKPPVYVGRYKSEQSARDACARLLQKTLESTAKNRLS